MPCTTTTATIVSIGHPKTAQLADSAHLLRRQAAKECSGREGQLCGRRSGSVRSSRFRDNEHLFEA